MVVVAPHSVFLAVLFAAATAGAGTAGAAGAAAAAAGTAQQLGMLLGMLKTAHSCKRLLLLAHSRRRHHQSPLPECLGLRPCAEYADCLVRIGETDESKADRIDIGDESNWACPRCVKDGSAAVGGEGGGSGRSSGGGGGGGSGNTGDSSGSGGGGGQGGSGDAAGEADDQGGRDAADMPDNTAAGQKRSRQTREGDVEAAEASKDEPAAAKRTRRR